MSKVKVYTATYDAENKLLRLTEPLEGVKHGEKVRITISRLDEKREEPLESPATE